MNAEKTKIGEFGNESVSELDCQSFAEITDRVLEAFNDSPLTVYDEAKFFTVPKEARAYLSNQEARYHRAIGRAIGKQYRKSGCTDCRELQQNTDQSWQKYRQTAKEDQQFNDRLETKHEKEWRQFQKVKTKTEFEYYGNRRGKKINEAWLELQSLKDRAFKEYKQTIMPALKSVYDSAGILRDSELEIFLQTIVVSRERLRWIINYSTDCYEKILDEIRSSYLKRRKSTNAIAKAEQRTSKCTHIVNTAHRRLVRKRNHSRIKLNTHIDLKTAQHHYKQFRSHCETVLCERCDEHPENHLAIKTQSNTSALKN